MCKRITQSVWPWKFLGRRVFHYSQVRVVLPLSVKKWPKIHPTTPHPPNLYIHQIFTLFRGSTVRKVPKLAFSRTRLQHNDNSILSLRSPNKLALHLFIIFSLLCSHYVIDLIKKLEKRLMVVSIFLKIKFRHAQMSVPKIGILMSKTASINPCYYLKLEIKE